MATSNTLPSSDYQPEERSAWGDAYAQGLKYPRIGPNQSWLDPIMPSIDPSSFQDDRPPAGQAYPFPSDDLLDRLFHSERAQLDQLGLRTWEVVKLLQQLDPGVEEDWIWNESHVLTPDDSSWLKVFRRSHWCNLSTKVLETAPALAAAGFQPEDTWSVDDPRIWKELAVTSELANRIMIRATQDEWLQSFMNWKYHFEMISDSSGQGKVLRRIPHIPLELRLTPDECRQRLDCPYFHKRVYWALSHYSEQAPSVYHAYGITTPGYTSTWITLDLEPLKTMLNPKAKKSAKATARLMMASTMCHELMHALAYRELEDYDGSTEGKWRLQPNYWTEPFYHEENIAETGHSFVGATFGVDPRNPLVTREPRERNSHGSNGRHLVSVAKPWPQHHICSCVNTNHPPCPTYGLDARIKGFAHDCFTVPSGWTEGLQSHEFWESLVATYGSSALYIPRVVSSILATFYNPTYVAYMTYAHWNEEAMLTQPENFRPYLERLRVALTHARATWSALRPWYRDALARWSLTPYSYREWRMELEKANAEYFALPHTDFKESQAARFARLAIGFKVRIELGWDIRVGVSLTAVTPGDQDEESRGLKGWFYRGLGHLVRAALPSRKEDKVLPEECFDLGFVATQSVDVKTDQEGPFEWPEGWYEENVNPQRLGHATELIYLRTRHHDNLGAFNFVPRFERAADLERGRLCFESMFAPRSLVPWGLQQAYEALRHRLNAQIQVDAVGDDMWLDFDFRLPPYRDPVLTDGTIPTKAVLREISTSNRPAYLMEGETLLEAWSCLPEDNTFVEAYAQMAEVEVNGEMEAIPYLTIAQLYDRQCEDGGCFVLTRRDPEVETFRAQQVMKALAISVEELQQSMEFSQHGWILNKKESERLCVALKRMTVPYQPFARVVQWRRLEEVAIRDGKGGQPLWIVSSNNVYDITGLDFSHKGELLTRALRSRPGGNPMLAVQQAGFEADDVIEMLRPFRIGMLMAPGLDEETETCGIFTSDELGWHQFRETGMYVQIYDDVYDVANYAELHPGGIRLLENVAGRDATELFERFHQHDGKTLLDSIKALKIGRMVRKFDPDESLGALQIRIRDRIYDISSLDGTAGFDELQGLGGQDATALLPSEPDDKSELLRLWNEGRHLVIGKVVRALSDRAEMTAAQLAVHDGRDVHWFSHRASYLSVRGCVMDVTTLMQYGPRAITSRIARYVGKEVDNPEIAALLTRQFPFRIVARRVNPQQQEERMENGTQVPRKFHAWNDIRVKRLTLAQHNEMVDWLAEKRGEREQQEGQGQKADSVAAPAVQAQTPDDEVAGGVERVTAAPTDDVPRKRKRKDDDESWLHETAAYKSARVSKIARAAIDNLQVSLAAQLALEGDFRREQELSRALCEWWQMGRDWEAGRAGGKWEWEGAKTIHAN